MRQTMGFMVVWCGVTVLAASVTWFGVRDVLRSEVVNDVRVEYLSSALARTGASPLPPEPTSHTLPPGTPTLPPGRGLPTPYGTSGAVRNTLPPQAVRSPAKNGHRPVRSQDPALVEPRRPSTATATTTPRAARTPSASPRAAQTNSPAPRAAQESPSPTPTTQQMAAAGGSSKVVSTKSGSVTFSIESGVCRLVSATPNEGFEAKVSQAEGWIRVDLVQGQRGSAVYCIGGENRTEAWDY
ncbi:hypothetical protein [Streptosporangium sp. NPDC051022]|uniref:hypothetical protein n=1 Tax=Streptosporangium sp. NPDC051022 TaxID=3155752 RepID=UPI0034364513